MSNESEVFLAVRAYAASCNFTMALVLNIHVVMLCSANTVQTILSFNVFAVQTKFSTLSEI